MNEAPLNLGDTIVPKSDQLNADDLLVGPITVTVTGVRRGDKEQPVSVDLSGQRPYKPCKSMRRVLITAWGDDGRAWVGRSMTLYCDPNVMFGGVKVGGIRISHLSHIEGVLNLNLTATRGKKTPFVVRPLAVAPSADTGFEAPAEWMLNMETKIRSAASLEKLEEMRAFINDKALIAPQLQRLVTVCADVERAIKMEDQA